MAVVLITCPDEGSAREVAETLLRERLAACVSMIPGVRSSFWWQGAIEEAEEVLLVVKARVEHLGELVEAVKEVHPYEVPEVIALPIIGGHEGYLDWARRETAREG